MSISQAAVSSRSVWDEWTEPTADPDAGTEPYIQRDVYPAGEWNVGRKFNGNVERDEF